MGGKGSGRKKKLITPIIISLPHKKSRLIKLPIAPFRELPLPSNYKRKKPEFLPTKKVPPKLRVVLSPAVITSYREYCLMILNLAEKSNLLKELVMLLNTFRVLFQKQLHEATEALFPEDDKWLR